MNSDRAAQLDQKIRELSLSTRTTFPIFIPLHNWLRLNNQLYYNWHLNKFASVVNWIILIILLIGIGTFVLIALGSGLIVGILYSIR